MSYLRVCRALALSTLAITGANGLVVRGQQLASLAAHREVEAGIGCNQSEAGLTVRSLRGGGRIRARAAEVSDYGSGPALYFHYLTETDVNARARLQKEAEEVWIDLQADAEKANVKKANLWPENSRSHISTLLTYERSADGVWHEANGFLHDTAGDCGPSEESAFKPLPALPPLIEAARSGDVDEVVALIESGQSLDVRDELGATPLLYAIHLGRAESARVLIDAGADLEATMVATSPFSPGFTSLMLVAGQGDSDIVRRLIAAGAKVNAQSDSGLSSLMLAAHYGNGLAVEELLAAHADVNLVDRGGETALIKAVLGRESWRKNSPISPDCYLQIIRSLLTAGADPTARDSHRKTALALAKRARDRELVSLLEGPKSSRRAK